MDLTAEERLSDSPYVDRVWRNRSDQPGDFISIAVNHWEMVVTKRKGTTRITMRGPETKASPAYCPDDAEFFGILFKFGTFMPLLPAKNLVDTDIDLPDASSKSFWLDSTAWETPNFDNADIFVNKLVRSGLLVREPVVEAVTQGQLNDELSLRTAQRRYLQATGLTLSATRQTERARLATRLLKKGTSILDTVYEAGYFDQPHLTRSLKHFVGQTPAQLLDQGRTERLSFLFDPIQHDSISIDYDASPQQVAIGMW